MAKSCLILPSGGADPLVLSNLARVAVTARWFGLRGEMFAEFTQGLAEYRQARFVSATNWVQKALDFAAAPGGDFAYIEARMVLAMGQFQLGRTNEARATLGQGLKLAETTLPRIESGDLGSEWRYWLRSQALMKEAQTLIGGN